MNPKEISQKIFLSLKYEPRVFFHFCLSFILGLPKYENLVTLDSATLKNRLLAGHSIIRLGDGEAMLLTGRSIHYQKFSPELRRQLLTIIENYHKDSKYILAIPLFALTESAKSLNSRKRLRIWRLFRNLFKIKFSSKLPYADAVMFYHKGTFEEYILPAVLGKNIILLTKAENYNTSLQNYFKDNDLEVDFIPTPSQDTFTEIAEISKRVKSALVASTRPSVLLIASGPAAKALAYQFTEDGIQCIDLGHGIEIISQKDDYASRL